MGKHLCRSLFFSRSLKAENSIKKRLRHVFFCEFCEISKNVLITEHLRVTGPDFGYCNMFH